MSDDLGAVKGVGKDVEVALVSAQHDIDSAYQDALDNIRIKRARVDAEEVPHKPEAKEQKQKDIYANFRTNLLLLWSLSNALLAGLILSGDTSATFQGGGNNTQGIYMLVILGRLRGVMLGCVHLANVQSSSRAWRRSASSARHSTSSSASSWDDIHRHG